MRDDQASATAVLGGVLRAAHQVLDGPPRILSDPVAPMLVEGWSAEQIAARRERLDGRVMRHLRSAFVLRSRLVEDALRRAVGAGASQYVILGAGLDTFALRQPRWARGLRIVEVDHPRSQAFKRDCLRRVSEAPPENLVLCPVDLESISLADGLAASSFDPERPSFFSWLGTTQYLGRETLEETLRFVAGLPGPAGIGLTFALPEASLDGLDLEAARFSAAGAARQGEPWRSRFAADQVPPWLVGLGFDRVEVAAPDCFVDRFYRGRGDGLEPPGVERVACAWRGLEPGAHDPQPLPGSQPV